MFLSYIINTTRVYTCKNIILVLLAYYMVFVCKTSSKSMGIHPEHQPTPITCMDPTIFSALLKNIFVQMLLTCLTEKDKLKTLIELSLNTRKTSFISAYVEIRRKGQMGQNPHQQRPKGSSLECKARR